MSRKTKTSTKPAPKFSAALEPRLRVFLSVDLVGSTAFKQAQKHHLISKDRGDELPRAGPAWFKSILSFYRDFESLLMAEWNNFNATCAGQKLPPATKPEFWKSVGDELLYTFDLSQPREAASVMLLWIATLENYRKALKSNQPTLDIKSSAWIAGFPLMNSEVIFEHSPQSKVVNDALVYQFQLLNKWYGNANKRDNLTKDYVGPAIDTGFRISSNASVRKLAISVDLALLLTGVSLQASTQAKFKIFFDGTQVFKGVVGGRPYPVFWLALDGSGSLSDLEDKLVGRAPSEHSQIKAYCEEYIKNNSEYLIRPFIHNCNDELFSEMPTRYMERIENEERFLRQEGKLSVSTRQSLESDLKDGDLVDGADINRFVDTLSVAGVKGNSTNEQKC